MKLGGAAQGPGVVGGVSNWGGREEGEVPVFGDVPVERVEGVGEDGEEPVKERKWLSAGRWKHLCGSVCVQESERGFGWAAREWYVTIVGRVPFH